MKTKLAILAISFAATLLAFAQGATPTPSPTPSPGAAPAFTLIWNANPATDAVTSYTVYEHAGANYTLVSNVTGTPVPTTFKLANLTPGPHSYVVTASSANGQSGYSNEVGLPLFPSAPSGLRVTLTFGP